MAAPVIHPSADVEAGAVVGDGTRVWHFSHVMPGAVIGRDCILGQGVFVAATARIGDRVKIQNNVSVFDAVILEDDVFCGPSCVFTNVSTPRSPTPRKHRYEPTRVGRGATIGANATVVCGHDVGAWALVGAGAVVTADVPAYALMLGVPARQAGWVCECGERLPLGMQSPEKEAGCAACGRRYLRHAHGLAPA